MLRIEKFKDLNIIIKNGKIIYEKGNGYKKEKTFNLNLNDIRNQLRKIGYYCPYNRDTRDEYISDRLENYCIPFINFAYYYTLFCLLRIPTLQELYQTYIHIYCDKKDDKYIFKPNLDPNSPTFTEKELLGRIFRSYNSFNREIDLLAQLENYNGFSAQYDFQDDLNGVDFRVECNGKEFCIASYVETERSFQYKQRKNTFRHDYSRMNMVDIIAEIGKNGYKNCDNINGIYVYSQNFVRTKCNEILKMATN